MPILPMRQAAQAAGVSRQTLYRYVTQGKVSVSTLPDGSKGVDTSELLRVFGQLVESAETVSGNVTSHTKRPAQHTDVTAMLETDLTVTKAELAATKTAVEILREQLNEVRADKQLLTRLLEDKRPQTSASSGSSGLAVLALGLSLLAVILVLLMVMNHGT